MKNTMLQVGERIKSLRLQNKLTQKELAEKVGVTHEWICKIERGKAKNITVSLLTSIVDNLESNFNDLDVI
jgi:transcriptional regulator with XRE-family HTH domain